MTIDIERLATDAAYWDEVALDGATHYWPKHKAWYQLNSEGLFVLNSYFGRDSKRCMPDIIEEPGMIRRPARPQSEWVGGLPPVGCECEVTTAGIRGGIWQHVRVVHYAHGKVWLHKMGGEVCADDWITKVEFVKFRPIPTKAQREKDELIEKIQKATASKNYCFAANIADAILAAGWTKP